MGCARESGPMPSSAPNSEDVVASVLTFLASEPERLARFFILTGLSPDTIRQAAAAPGFTTSVLDYLLNDKPLLRLFTAGTEIAPGDLLHVRVGLERRGISASKTERAVAAPLGASNLARRFRSAPH
jgi:Protein of unknown function (DUF3572)